MLDVFDEEGRFLGTVEPPELIGTSPLRLFIDGDMVVTAAEDDEGVFRVKRYRLVLPGEPEDLDRLPGQD